MVTNPATRDWTVTASLFATLNEMFGNRTVCGIGRGDSAVRVTNGKPATLKELREATHVIRELANCRPVDYKGSHAAVPVGADLVARGLGRRVRPAGAQAGRRGRRRLHPAAGRRRHRRVDDQDACGRPRPHAGRDPDAITFCVAAPDVRRRRLGRTCATSAAGSAAWSATTWPTSSPSTATHSDGPGGADRLHQGPPGLRLQRARPGREHPRRLRARRDRRPVLHPRHRRGPHRQARAAARRSASTSSPATCSTTTRRRRSGSTARRSSPRSAST